MGIPYVWTHLALGLSFRNKVGKVKIASLLCDGNMPVLLLGKTWNIQGANIRIDTQS